MGYYTEVAADTPYLWWKLNETSGTSVADASGNSRTATHNSVTVNQTQIAYTELDKSVRYTAASNSYTTWTPGSAITSSFTVEFWVRTTTTAAYQNVLGAWSAVSSSNYGFAFAITSGGTCEAYTANSGFTNYQLHNPLMTLSTDTWYHVAAAYNSSTFDIKWYLNGALTATTNAGAASSLWNTSKPFTLGRLTKDGTATDFDGYLDEVAVYTSTLTGARILAHYEAVAVTNIDIAAGTTQNVTFTGLDATVDIIAGTSIPADNVPDITFTGLDATVLGEAQLTVTVDNVPTATFTMSGYDPYDLTVLSFNPDVYWNFQDLPASNGGVIKDISGNGRDLIKSGASTFDAENIHGHGSDAGYRGMSVVDTTTQFHIYREAVGTSSFITDEFTVAGWWNEDNVEPIGSPDYKVIYTNYQGTTIGYEPDSGGVGSFNVILSNAADTSTGNVNFNVLAPNLTVSDGWNHYALVVRSTGRVVYLYINGVLRGEGTWSALLGTAGLGTARLQVNTYSRGSGAIEAGTAIDDIAIWERELSASDILILSEGTEDIVIAADATKNITFTGLSCDVGAGINITVLPETANVSYQGLNTSLQVNGGISFQPDTPNITLAGLAPTIDVVSYITETVSNLPNLHYSAPDALVLTRPDNLDFEWIQPLAIEFTARDAETLSSLDYGALFQGQDRVLAFRLGNTSSISTDFLIYAASINATIVDSVLFSLDQSDWSTSLLIEHIGANAITDVIYVKVALPDGALVGTGTFTITVEQNA